MRKIYICIVNNIIIENGTLLTLLERELRRIRNRRIHRRDDKKPKQTKTKQENKRKQTENKQTNKKKKREEKKTSD